MFQKEEKEKNCSACVYEIAMDVIRLFYGCINTWYYNPKAASYLVTDPNLCQNSDLVLYWGKLLGKWREGTNSFSLNHKTDPIFTVSIFFVYYWMLKFLPEIHGKILI